MTVWMLLASAVVALSSDPKLPPEFYQSNDLRPDQPVTFFVTNIGKPGREQLFITADVLLDGAENDRALWEIYERAIGSDAWAYLDRVVLSPDILYRVDGTEREPPRILSIAEDNLSYVGVTIIEGEVKVVKTTVPPSPESKVSISQGASQTADQSPPATPTPAPGSVAKPSPAVSPNVAETAGSNPAAAKADASAGGKSTKGEDTGEGDRTKRRWKLIGMTIAFLAVVFWVASKIPKVSAREKSRLR